MKAKLMESSVLRCSGGGWHLASTPIQSRPFSCPVNGIVMFGVCEVAEAISE